MRRPIFDAVRAMLGRGFTPAEIAAMDAACDAAGLPKEAEAPPAKPFDRAEFLNRYVNTNAPAITDAAIQDAATRLAVTPAHIRAVKAVESNGKSFDMAGRPVILFEPHVFYKRTEGRFGVTSFSYPKWGAKPYPKTADERWAQMADAAAWDETAALESASWGLFQIMGYHWRELDYASVQDFCERLTTKESEHLDAVVRFIVQMGIAPALRRCKPGDADSCRDFAKGYNGQGYERNAYHRKLAEALK